MLDARASSTVSFFFFFFFLWWLDGRLACVLERDVLLALPDAPLPIESLWAVDSNALNLS